MTDDGTVEEKRRSSSSVPNGYTPELAVALEINASE